MNSKLFICTVFVLVAIASAAVTTDLSESESAKTQMSGKNKMRRGEGKQGGGGRHRGGMCAMKTLVKCVNSSTDEAAKLKMSELEKKMKDAKDGCGMSRIGHGNRSRSSINSGEKPSGANNKESWGKKFTAEQMTAFQAKVKENMMCVLKNMSLTTEGSDPKLNMTAVQGVMMSVIPNTVNTKAVDTFNSCLKNKGMKVDSNMAMDIGTMEPRIFMNCTMELMEAVKVACPRSTQTEAQTLEDEDAD